MSPIIYKGSDKNGPSIRQPAEKGLTMLKKLWNWITWHGSARAVELGSRWVMPLGTGNPWRDESIYAVVAEVKLGWVKLKLNDGGNYEMPIERFLEWFKETRNGPDQGRRTSDSKQP